MSDYYPNGDIGKLAEVYLGILQLAFTVGINGNCRESTDRDTLLLKAEAIKASMDLLITNTQRLGTCRYLHREREVE